MKITFLTRSLDYGGAERQLVTLAKGLHERGHRVVVLVFYANGPLEKELYDAGVTVRVLDKKGRWDVAGFLCRLVHAVVHDKPDIVHGYLGIPNILTVLLKPIFSGTRMVWGVRASNMDLARYDWLSRLSYQLECMLSRFADLIITNSHAGFDYAAKNGFPKSKMVVIPNGIDTDRFRPDPEAGRLLRMEWGVADNEKLIGLVGRLDPMKDHPTFLRAAALLRNERKDVRFVCVGDGATDYRKKLQALGKELGLEECLIWAGTRGDMFAVYNALDIASSTSYGEGFPNVIGEAMACGVPCVVTDVGDSSWIVGDVGVVVPPRDPHALAAGLKIALAQWPNKGGFSGRDRISHCFSVQLLIHATENALRDVGVRCR
ncbi:MAG: glycosyltransferase [Syntrophomonadaceae bacterium]|nr:glycosyltransferase [Syntrophomonadaceae bacterium]